MTQAIMTYAVAKKKKRNKTQEWTIILNLATYKLACPTFTIYKCNTRQVYTDNQIPNKQVLD